METVTYIQLLNGTFKKHIFKEEDLQECHEFEVPHLALLQIRYYEKSSYPAGFIDLPQNPFQPLDEGVWNGKFIEIGFHNHSKRHCDLMGASM